MSHKCPYKNIRADQIDPPECEICDIAYPELVRLKEEEEYHLQKAEECEEKIFELHKQYPELNN